MIETIQSHTLHPRYLNENSNVIDIGANYGHFAQAITRRFGCRCLAVEPSPEPFAAIPETANISKLHAAVSNRSGRASFYVASDSVASSLSGGAVSIVQTTEVNVFSLSDLLDHVGLTDVDLLKIDVEGAEIEMLNGCSERVLRRIAQISVEFHDFCGITPLLSVKRTLMRLRSNGFF